VLLDIGSVLGGIGLAVVGFIVVILVCVVILRLLAAILPSYEDRTASGDAGEAPDVDAAGSTTATDPDTDTPGVGAAPAAEPSGAAPARDQPN
jgi:hypothetical protein